MGDIDYFNWFLPLKNQINSKKPSFWKEKSVEDVVTLGSLLLARPTKARILC
jgi:hypothetical protein